MKIPRLRFQGDFSADILNAVFAENLRDLRDKAETKDGEFARGFLHTSTNRHERTCYYDQMWARDVGRGVIELARLGFICEAEAVCDYLMNHLSYGGTHWAREIHNPGSLEAAELDGNALILLGFYNTWYMSGRDKALGKRLLSGLSPVLNWCKEQIEGSAYHNLMESRSELSGNPGTPYSVYGVFGNYGMFLALGSLAQMATGDTAKELAGLAEKLKGGIANLVSDGKISRAEKGCFFNGIDARDFSAYDIMYFAENECEAWHWTRQLVNILDPDGEACGNPFAAEHDNTYRFIRRYMASGEYFRKYGFVSNTGWTGIGERHDETMCGYGQGFFSQAALLADDVNCYGKCLEGIARLGYDGSVLTHLSHDNNPFVMHECFCYEHYEQGLDHTYGGRPGSDPKTTENPGDEGNLVQAAEIVKALRLVAGISFDGRGTLTVTPRLPWLYSELEVTDYPVLNKDGKPSRVSFVYRVKRHLRAAEIEITDGFEAFKNVSVRFGPFPHFIKGVEGEKKFDATWLTRKLDSPKLTLSLDDEQDNQ